LIGQNTPRVDRTINSITMYTRYVMPIFHFFNCFVC